MTTTTDTRSALLPPWAEHDPVGQAYYLDEYGVAVTDERGLFELVALEVFVVGLSWLTILRRRAAMREAFGDFEVDVVAAYDDEDVERLLADERLIRNERKIRTVIANARAAVALRADGGLPAVVWAVQPEVTPTPATLPDVPTTSEAGDRLSETLHAKGFTGIGPTTMHALLGAAGVMDLHLVGSPTRNRTGLWTRTGRRRARPALEE
ncbi:MAG TPA: DNA-3-methyladenine glycosylase I [Propionibacteriaceae bacterium]|nr:DNA-3-methyladenine glycosylase I [Propionibacteriaceae bacterium]